jgi:hypothetical protein
VSESSRHKRTIAWLVCDPMAPVALGGKPEVTIGRSTTCDLVLPHSSVSRVHAVVRLEGDGFVVEDRSSFGCFVNGERISGPKPLGGGDLLTIGPFKISIARIDGTAASSLETTQPLVVPVDPLLAHGTAMAGRFEKVSPIELLQGFEFHRKTAKLTIETEGMDGELVVIEGRLTRARLGIISSFEAAVAVANLKAGFFSVTEPDDDDLKGTFNASIMEVLLEAYRRQDEVQRHPPEA